MLTHFRPLVIIPIVAILTFAILKQLRPDLAQAFPGVTFEVILYSFLNFAEGLVGFLCLAMLLTMASHEGGTASRLLTLPRVCVLAFLGAGSYVVSLEVGLHNPGGDQIYDLYDVYFSIAGVVTGLVAFLRQKPTRGALPLQ